MKPMAPSLTALALACALGAACKHSRSSAQQGEPAPSASVISIGVALGTCDDIAACERECDAGSADRCRRLGASYAFGKGVDQSEPQATLLYSHACDMKDPSACVFAGQNYEFARGVAKNDATAARFYERACDLGWAPGCYNLAIMYERGTGVPANRERASELYQVACTAGARQACEKAREMHATPTPPFLEGGLR
jgi:TPR repeat protein